MFISAGILLLLHRRVQPWLQTVAAVGSALIFGLLVARLIGIVMDGSVAKQWMYVGIECVILAPLLWWYFRLRGNEAKLI